LWGRKFVQQPVYTSGLATLDASVDEHTGKAIGIGGCR
jgi:hypothetical protein